MGHSTADRLREGPGAAQRDLRDNDDEHYVARASPLSLGQVQGLPVPGRLDLGDEEIELHPAEGHTADGLALFARSLDLLVVGDYLSDVEIPMISEGGSLDVYRSTLARLAPLAEEARTVVPGHGSPHDRETALRILDEDVDYLDALGARRRAPRPPGRPGEQDAAAHSRGQSQASSVICCW